MTETSTAIAERVAAIVAGHFRVDPAVLKPETNFREHLQGDDLDRLELMLAIEEQCDVVFEDDDMDEFETLGRLIEVTTKRVAEQRKAA